MQTWGKWKELNKKAEKKAIVKRQDAGGHDQFGRAVIGAGVGGATAPGGGGTTVTIDELEGCFDRLAMAANKEKKRWMNW